MSGSNRTDQLLQQVMFPRVATTVSDVTAYKLVVDLSCDTLYADTAVVNNLTYGSTSFGTSNGALFLGLNSARTGLNRQGTTGVGVNVGCNSSNISNNVLMGFNVLRESKNICNSVWVGSMGSTTQTVSGIVNSVFIGYQAGLSNQRGSAGNVVIGYQAGRNLSGDSNIVIGSSAGETLNGTGNILLGAGVDVSADNTFIVGRTSNYLLHGTIPTLSDPEAHLGIGRVADPSWNLSVSGTSIFKDIIAVGDDVIRAEITPISFALGISDGSITNLGQAVSWIGTGTHQLGINTYNPEQNLDVSGSVRITGTLNMGTSSGIYQLQSGTPIRQDVADVVGTTVPYLDGFVQTSGLYDVSSNLAIGDMARLIYSVQDLGVWVGTRSETFVRTASLSILTDPSSGILNWKSGATDYNGVLYPTLNLSGYAYLSNTGNGLTLSNVTIWQKFQRMST